MGTASNLCAQRSQPEAGSKRRSEKSGPTISPPASSALGCPASAAACATAAASSAPGSLLPGSEPPAAATPPTASGSRMASGRTTSSSDRRCTWDQVTFHCSPNCGPGGAGLWAERLLCRWPRLFVFGPRSNARRGSGSWQQTRLPVAASPHPHLRPRAPIPSHCRPPKALPTPGRTCGCTERST